MLLFCIIFVSFGIRITAKQCPIGSRIEPKVILIGEPPSHVKITWTINNQSLFQNTVTTQVFYRNESNTNRCDCTSNNKNIDAGCSQVSSHSKHVYSCTLSKEILAQQLDSSNYMPGLCIILKASSGNWTEFQFLTCGMAFSLGSYCENVCPSPTVNKITTTKPRQFIVIFDASRDLSKDGLLDISIMLQYRRTLELATSSLKNITESKIFKPTNNNISIDGLEPYTQYQVRICCFFGRFLNPNHPCTTSGFHNVTTAEEAPSRPPIVTDEVELANKWLKLTIKRPPRSTWNGRLVRYEITLQQSSKNCTVARTPKDIIKINITDNSANVDQVHVILPHRDGPMCYNVRICTRPGCGPWSRGHGISGDRARDTTTPLSRRNATSLTYIITFSVVGVLVLVILSYVLCKRPTTRRHADSLPDIHGHSEVDSLTSTTDIEQPEEDPYAQVQHEGMERL